MTKRETTVSVGTLALAPLGAFAGATVVAPDPVGDELYRIQVYSTLIPLALLIGTGLAAWLMHKILHPGKHGVAGHSDSSHA